VRVITHTCSDCGTIVAANVLEEERVLKCPGLECDAILRFTDLSKEERKFFLENRERYRMD
jgi:hypothetical protein